MELLTLLAFIALVLASLALISFAFGRLAVHFDQPFWPYFFGGLIFWPGALLVLWLQVMSDRSRERPPRAPIRRRSRVCEHCGYRLAEGASS